MTDLNRFPTDHYTVLNQSSRSFSMAARLLPKNTREDVARLYAWCRWCDDAVDEAGSFSEARDRLQELKTDVRRIYHGLPTRHPASKWLAAIVRKYQIPISLPIDLLRGMELDLRHRPFTSVKQLVQYSYLVAGTVGLMMSRILGATNPDALRRAKSLGIAMQLTNIARDVRDDWRMGRRYIPTPWLELDPNCDIEPTSQMVRSAAKKLLDLADVYYAMGFSGLEHLPDSSRLSIRISGTIYREIGETIRRNNCDVMRGRISVPLRRKTVLAGKCVLEEIVIRSRRWGQHTFSLIIQLTHRFCTPLFDQGNLMNTNSWYMLFLGFSLTLITGATLFALVGINPKDPSYSNLPWIYSAICLALALVTGMLAKSMERSEGRST
ncbi:MAG: phytoene/squalene synthase family protein [Pirellulales bacterium]